jgi:hypothetical protein
VRESVPELESAPYDERNLWRAINSRADLGRRQVIKTLVTETPLTTSFPLLFAILYFSYRIQL